MMRVCECSAIMSVSEHWSVLLPRFSHKEHERFDSPERCHHSPPCAIAEQGEVSDAHLSKAALTSRRAAASGDSAAGIGGSTSSPSPASAASASHSACSWSIQASSAASGGSAAAPISAT